MWKRSEIKILPAKSDVFFVCLFLFLNFTCLRRSFPPISYIKVFIKFDSCCFVSKLQSNSCLNNLGIWVSYFLWLCLRVSVALNFFHSSKTGNNDTIWLEKNTFSTVRKQRTTNEIFYKTRVSVVFMLCLL